MQSTLLYSNMYVLVGFLVTKIYDPE